MNISGTVRSHVFNSVLTIVVLGSLLQNIGQVDVHAAIGVGELEDFVNFESPQVHPLELTPDGSRLLVANTADNRLEVFEVLPNGLAYLKSIQVYYQSLGG